MAEDLGRAVAFTWGAVSIPGVRQKTITRNGVAIDVTSDENNGARKVLAEAGQDNIDLGISGITKVKAMRDDWHAGNRTKQVVITYPDGSTLTGDFFLQDFNETAPYNEAMTFEATLLSDGAVVYVPGV